MRDWLNSIFGQDGGRLAQFAFALVAVLIAIMLMAWIIRRLQSGSGMKSSNAKSRKRLGVLEASEVDARRRLVLVRRDEVEHLIMIGGPNDLLIESRILRSNPAGQRPGGQASGRPTPATDPDRYIPQPAQSASAPMMVPEAVQPPVQVRADSVTKASIQAVAAATEQPVPPAAPPLNAGAPLASKLDKETAAQDMRTGLQTAGVTAPTGDTEIRRPSLGDLLSAAAAAKANDASQERKPVLAPPPPRHALPDLEEDDRDVATQIIMRRPSILPAPPADRGESDQPPQAQPTPASPGARGVAAPAIRPPLVEPQQARDTDVSTQIELALSDLTVANLVAPVEQKHETSVQPKSVPTLPPVPPRPVPARPFAPRDVASPVPPVESAGGGLHQADAAFEELLTKPLAPTQPVVGRSSPEPATAPRPSNNPTYVLAPEKPLPSAPPVLPQESPAPKSKTDELEEEMARLLQELGGTPSK